MVYTNWCTDDSLNDKSYTIRTHQRCRSILSLRLIWYTQSNVEINAKMTSLIMCNYWNVRGNQFYDYGRTYVRTDWRTGKMYTKLLTWREEDMDKKTKLILSEKKSPLGKGYKCSVKFAFCPTLKSARGRSTNISCWPNLESSLLVVWRPIPAD